MTKKWVNREYDLQNIKLAVVAIQLGIITLEQAQDALCELQKKNILPTKENFAQILMYHKFITSKELDILNFYIKNQSEICICNDCTKYFIITNFRADRNYNCPNCSSPLYLVRSPKAKFRVNELEPIDGFDSLTVPLVVQMQDSIKSKSYKEFRQYGFSTSAMDSDDAMLVYDNTIPKGEKTKKEIPKPVKTRGDGLKKLNEFIKTILPGKINQDLAQESSTADVKTEKPKPGKNKIKKLLKDAGQKLDSKNKKSVFASLKENKLDIQLTDLQEPMISEVAAKIFPESLISKKKLDIDTKISLSPIPSIGSKIKIASNDRYVLIKEIARGGMGVVYLAFDQDLRRYVAMKVIKPKENLKLRHLHRFIQESQILAQLEHPNNVPIHEFGVTTEGHLFFTMKYIEGISLAYLIAKYHRGSKLIRENYPLKKQLELLLQIFDAIAYAHARGVIHRDLKPENVMIGAFGEVVLMDWGLARVQATRKFVIEESETVVSSSKAEIIASETNDGQVVGTPTYMPPEQTTGKAQLIDERVDIYALGAICYEIITGRPPFIERDVWKLINDIRTGNFPRPSELVPEIDPRLETIILKAMHITKQKRYQTVFSFKTDLVNFLYSTIKQDLTKPKPYETGRYKISEPSELPDRADEITSKIKRDTIFTKKIIKKLKDEQKNSTEGKIHSPSDSDK